MVSSFLSDRPRVREFLSYIKELYELHIYTMGTRAYATHVTRILDPSQDTFTERVLSRDDCPGKYREKSSRIG